MKKKDLDLLTGLLLVALFVYLASLVTGCKTVVSDSEATIYGASQKKQAVIVSRTKAKGFFVKSEYVQPSGTSTNEFTLKADGTFDYDSGKTFEAASVVSDPDEAALKAQGEAIGKAVSVPLVEAIQELKKTP